MNSPFEDDNANADPPSPRTEALMHYENWLRLIARLEIDHRFQGKFSQSDVVQQTLLEAWKNWDAFEPGDDSQSRRMAWLRRILANQIAGLARKYGAAQKRDVAREVSIDQSLNATSTRLASMLPADVSSPSAQLNRRENQLQLADVLSRLPEDYREVIVLRNLEELSHAEIATRMDRSEGAVRMLWIRALAELKRQVDA